MAQQDDPFVSPAPPPPPPMPPMPPTMAIGKVQGDGETSPLIGRVVVVEGVVTARFEHPARAAGKPIDRTNEPPAYSLQDSGDSDPATSDAIFVIDPQIFLPGQRVRLLGTVVEFDDGRSGSRTALKPFLAEALGSARLPAPLRLAAAPADWEHYEAMRVEITAPLTLAGTHRAVKYGEILVNFGERLVTPTEVAAPGAAAKTLATENMRRRLWLDDASTIESPARLWYLPQGLPRTDSRLSRVEGVVDQRNGGYGLQLTAVPKMKPASRPRAPNVGGDLRVVGFNLENLFNGDGRGGGFPTSRGARTLVEYQAQLDRHLATIRALKPDILALMELENDGNGPDSSIAALVTAMRAAGLGDDWRFVDAGEASGSDQIRVALLYRASRVAPVGTPATLSDGPFLEHSRAPLAQSFRAIGPGSRAKSRANADAPAFTIAVNHFKSKGCTGPGGKPATGADADQGDGQGCWNAMRTESARRIGAWLGSDPTGSGSDLAMIIGDLNAYGMEDPIRTLTAEGWLDAYAEPGGKAPYSYVFDGQIGRLDHALLSPALAQRLAGAAKWHANADEPVRSAETGALGEGTPKKGKSKNSGSTGPWRSSDHDPLLLGFRLSR